METKKIRKILVADNNKEVVECIKKTLEKRNYKVTTVLSGQEALKELRKRKYNALFIGELFHEITEDSSGFDVMGIVSGKAGDSKKFFGNDAKKYERFKEKYKNLPMILIEEEGLFGKDSFYSSTSRILKMVGARNVLYKNRRLPFKTNFETAYLPIREQEPVEKSELIEMIEKYL